MHRKKDIYVEYTMMFVHWELFTWTSGIEVFTVRTKGCTLITIQIAKIHRKINFMAMKEIF
jgi:hypothetical protein